MGLSVEVEVGLSVELAEIVAVAEGVAVEVAVPVAQVVMYTEYKSLPVLPPLQVTGGIPPEECRRLSPLTPVWVLMELLPLSLNCPNQ